MNNIRVLFIVKERNVYGTKTRCYGLFNSCNFVANKLNELGIWAKTVQVIDNNCIDKWVKEYKPTHCIIEALWVVPEKFRILSKLHPNINWNIRIHSAAAFLATEGISTQWIKEYNDLRKEGIKISVSANHKDVVEDLRVITHPVYYLPNIYFPKTEKTEHIKYFEKGENIIKVGCFGALRPLKNHYKQALLSLRYAKKHNKILHFYINQSEHEKETANSVLKNLIHLFKNFTTHKLISIPWYEHGDFIEIVKQMDIGMQLSFTETFNIVAADFIHNNIPIITSKSIDWVSSIYRADIDNSEEILQKMELAILQKHTNEDKDCLSHYNKQSIQYWLDYLK